MTIPVLGGRETWTRMVIAISGSSGLIGSALTRMFEQRGNEVRRLVRRPARDTNEISWDPQRGTIEAAKLEGVDAVINLAGENLAQRWTSSVKPRLRQSRITSTALLSRTIASLREKPSVFLSGSAIGYYGSRGNEVLDEQSSAGSDFLATICVDWEATTAPASDAGVRVANLRTGLVLSGDGGVLAKMLLPFRLGVGGRLGDGRQWMSWIGMADYVEAVGFLMRSTSPGGAFNLVAPNPVTNAEFASTLARVLRRPAFFPVPKAALKLVYGKMADETIFASQLVRPVRLLEAGFEFQCSTLEAALRHELSRSS
jgi:uncharacterized protein